MLPANERLTVQCVECERNLVWGEHYEDEEGNIVCGDCQRDLESDYLE